MRERFGNAWWQAPLGLLLGYTLSVSSNEVATFVPGSWRALATWVSLAVGLTAAILAFRASRLRWLFIALAIGALSYSVSFAQMQGWDAQIVVGFLIACVALMIAMVVAFVMVLRGVGRLFVQQTRQLRDTAREIGERAQHEGAFRNDGERIVVYPGRSGLLVRTLQQAALLALFVGAYLWARAVPLSGVGQVMLALDASFPILYIGVLTLLSLTRLMMRGPTLVINADGILDNCSLMVTGRGLLRWSEILSVMQYSLSTRRHPHGHLVVNLVATRAVIQRQPRWKRALAFFVPGGQNLLGLRIPPALLDRSASELVNEINGYIKRHAPEGGWRSMMDSERVGIVSRYINTHTQQGSLQKAVSDNEPEQPGED